MVGHFWRYRYDKFGWTTRSSQLYEDRLLRIGSPLFHFGMLGVVGGHVIGLLIPQVVDRRRRASASTPTTSSRSCGGLLAGVDGAGRHGHPDLPAPHRRAGVLGDHPHGQGDVRLPRRPSIVLGMWNTIAGSIIAVGGEYDYREGVSVWYRSFLAFQPDAELMADAPLGFQLHALVAFGLFALWPFTRLVHVFSAPVGYLTRPYIVYRSRDVQLGSHSPRRGW